MGVLLKDIMTVFPFSEAKLVGGKKGIERMVQSASIQEVDDAIKRLKGGELLFTSVNAFGTAKNGCRLISKLSQRGVTGLVVKPGKYMPDIPEDMTELADELNFPVFLLPESAAYLDCVIPIFERIVDSQVFILRRSQNIHALLLQSMVQNKGIQGICEILASVNKRPVFVITNTGNLISGYDPQNPSRWEKCENSSQFLPLQMKKISRAMVQNLSTNIHIDENTELICTPVNVQGKVIAYLMMEVTEKRMMMEGELFAFEHANVMVGIELLKKQAILQKENRNKELLLEDILTQRYTHVSTMIQRGEYVGLDFTREYYIFELGAVRENDELSNPLFREEIRVYVQQELEKSVGDLLIMIDGFHFVGLINFREKKDKERLKQILLFVVKKMNKKWGKFNFMVGVSRARTEIAEAKEAWEEAKSTWKAVKRCNDGYVRHVTFFEELGCLIFLNELKDSPAMRGFYNERMKKLEEADMENGVQLIKTLQSYFKNNRNMRETADELYIHKNSLKYRLKKIESITNMSLNDSQDLLELQICLELKNIM